jgi:hypothetical protein
MLDEISIREMADRRRLQTLINPRREAVIKVRECPHSRDEGNSLRAVANICGEGSEGLRGSAIYRIELSAEDCITTLVVTELTQRSIDARTAI